jgi:hypothetical protein
MSIAELDAAHAKTPHLSRETLAYYRGRNSVWNRSRGENPFAGTSYAEDWARGRRHAFAEEALDADTEWDGDAQETPR